MVLVLARLFSLTVVLFLTGCKIATTSQVSPARIPVHSQESLVELRQSARMLFNGRDIVIGANAFARTNQIIIQRRAIRSPDGRLIDTRVDEEPFTLEIYLRDGGCYLRNATTGQEVRLIRANCVALTP